MKTPISITALASISPLGIFQDEIWTNYQNDAPLFTKKNFNGGEEWVGALSEAAKSEIDRLKHGDSKYKNLDNSVLYALYASRMAVEQAGWGREGNAADRGARRFGINIGSSRGATSLFERYHGEFLENHRASTLSSPTTTLGNISSWIAHDLQTQGPEISHSITCSTALHSLLNGVAWINSGMTDQFLVGGSEAPLTPFTIAQMKALKIYARANTDETTSGNSASVRQQSDSAASEVQKTAEARLEFENAKTNGSRKVQEARTGGESPPLALFPCQALNLDKKRNSMVLGEGASVACLERGKAENALALIEGIGYATEPLRHNTSISTDAECFQRSMRMALADTRREEVDAIVMHAPGTIKGDLSEYKAIEKVFDGELPLLTTNKWKIGHTFGASGMLSVELALLMLKHQQVVSVPFIPPSLRPKRIEKVLVNAVGFGGNAVSVLLGRAEQ